MSSSTSPTGTPPNPIGKTPVQVTGTGTNITPANANSKILEVLTGKFGLNLKSTPLSERSATTTTENLQAPQGSNTSASSQAEAAGKSDQAEASVESPKAAQSSSKQLKAAQSSSKQLKAAQSSSRQQHS